MISILFGTGGSNPVEETEKEKGNPAEDGYVLIKTVEWPATDPATIKGRFFTGQYPADPNLEGYREELESPEHEAAESPETEKKEHM